VEASRGRKLSGQIDVTGEVGDDGFIAPEQAELFQQIEDVAARASRVKGLPRGKLLGVDPDAALG
jgi:hypothetical protein